jgi:hypothetical protein
VKVIVWVMPGEGAKITKRVINGRDCWEFDAPDLEPDMFAMPAYEVMNGGKAKLWFGSRELRKRARTDLSNGLGFGYIEYEQEPPHGSI